MSGEIDMDLDGTIVHLKAGDVLVQRGTIQNWINKSTEPCVIAFTLVSAKPATAAARHYWWKDDHHWISPGGDRQAHRAATLGKRRRQLAEHQSRGSTVEQATQAPGTPSTPVSTRLLRMNEGQLAHYDISRPQPRPCVRVRDEEIEVRTRGKLRVRRLGYPPCGCPKLRTRPVTCSFVHGRQPGMTL